MSFQLQRHVAELEELIEALRVGYHRQPCPRCHGWGRIKRVVHGAAAGRWHWRRILVRLRGRLDRIVHENCDRCDGTGHIRVEPDRDLAERMAIELKYIAREVDRLSEADAALRAAGVRIEQKGTRSRYREGQGKEGEVRT